MSLTKLIPSIAYVCFCSATLDHSVIQPIPCFHTMVVGAWHCLCAIITLHSRKYLLNVSMMITYIDYFPRQELQRHTLLAAYKCLPALLCGCWHPFALSLCCHSCFTFLYVFLASLNDCTLTIFMIVPNVIRVYSKQAYR